METQSKTNTRVHRVKHDIHKIIFERALNTECKINVRVTVSVQPSRNAELRWSDKQSNHGDYFSEEPSRSFANSMIISR